MGASSSKATRTAVGAAARKYPSRTLTHPAPTSTSQPLPTSTNAISGSTSASPGANVSAPENERGHTAHSRAQPSATRTDEINLDARDPQLASRLTELGPVQPYPTYSSSSRSNPRTASSSPSFPQQYTGGPHSPTTTFQNPSSTTTSPSTRTNRTAALSASPFGRGTYPTPAANPAIAILAARSRIAEAVELEKVEAGRTGFEGRTFMDIKMIKEVLVLRDEQGVSESDIEKRLGLRGGVVRGFGRRGIVEVA